MSDPMENSTPPPPSPPPPPPPPVPPDSPMDGSPGAEERQWAMFAHLSAIVGAVLTSALGGGWGCFIGPLVIWLMKKDTMPFVADQAKEALNFNITLAIIMVALVLFSFLTLGVGFLITIPIMILISIGALVLIVMAAIKANEGKAYRYPLTIRLIK